MKKIFKASAISVMLLILMTGCGNEQMEKLVSPREDSWTPVERESVTVMRGNITPEFEAEIDLSGYDEKIYRLTAEEFGRIENQYKVKMEEVRFDVGDRVKAGDTLISFSSDSLKNKLEESKTEAAIAALGIDHFTNLYAIDPTGDYLIDLKKQMNSKHLADMYIKDINNTYDNMNIVAESDGIITFIDPAAKDGNPAVGKPLIRVVRDDGYYVLRSDSISANSIPVDTLSGNTTGMPEFNEGDVFPARNGLSEYEVEVIAPPEDEDGNAKEGVFFKVVSDEDVYAGMSLTLTAPMEELKNVCYVSKNAVMKTSEGDYVYLIGDDNVRRAVRVYTGSIVGENVIILEGLEGGEEVVLP